MAEETTSFWPDAIKATIASPKSILDVQARALKMHTKGLVLGELEEYADTQRKWVHLRLNVFAPAITFRRRILEVQHDAKLPYPARIISDAIELEDAEDQRRQQSVETTSADQFANVLRGILNAPKTVVLIQALVASSNESKTDFDFVEHARNLDRGGRARAAQARIERTYHEILDSRAFEDAVATTGTEGWGIERFGIMEIDVLSDCTVRLQYFARREDIRAEVTGTAKAVINSMGGVAYSDITAQLRYTN
jgi:hypothetical protein